MKFYLPFFLMVVAVSMPSYTQVPQKISYQGLLTTGAGSPIADGNYDLKFEIFDLPSAGALRHTETQTEVPVQRGTFSVILGSVTPLAMTFNESLYVEVTVVTGPPGPFYPLTFSSRSELTSAPYALQSISLLGPNSIATGVAANAGGNNNRAIGDYSAVLGGQYDTANGHWSTVGGGYGNLASAGVSTIGGGQVNKASGDYSTIGGGFGNVASSPYSTVGGGFGNTANSLFSGTSSTVGGGYQNTAGDNSTVGGGEQNRAIGTSSTIGGGYNNVANGPYATIPGGANDSASGYTSFAAGWNAKARHDYSFVWSDGNDFGSTGVGQFLISAIGGVGIGTNSPQAMLNIAGTGTGQTGAIRLDNGAIATQLVSDATQLFGQFGTLTNHSLNIMTASTSRIFIKDSGKVGIGTTNPTEQLEVNGNAKASNGYLVGTPMGNGYKIQTGSIAVTFSNENIRSGTVLFPSTYTSTPIVFVSQSNHALYPIHFQTNAESATGFSWRGYNILGGNISTTTDMSWIAIGK